MIRHGRHSAHRTGLALAGALLVVAGATATAPAVPRVSAVDPTPDPSASVSPDPGPTPTVPPDPTSAPTPDPSADPTPTPSPDPSSDPGITPTPPPDVTPSPAPSDSAPPVDPSSAPSAEPSSNPSPSPTATPVPTPPTGLAVAHTWVDTIDDAGAAAHRGAADGSLTGMERFTVYRVRFQVLNSGVTEIRLSPRLEAGSGTSPVAWSPVPVVDPTPGQPFYVASDEGKGFRVRSAVIAPSALRSAAGPAPDFQPMAGVTSAGLNPAPTVVLPARTFTEIEFAVRATVNAAWSETYAFRLQPTADTVAGGSPVVVTMRSRPPIVLTLPPSATRTPASLQTGLASPRYQLAVAAPGPQVGAAYPLAAYVDPTSPHVESSLVSDSCAACHSAHRATSQLLLDDVYRVNPLRSATEPYSGADFALCIECHQESPFADTSGSPNALTSFPGHGFHLGDIENTGTGGLDITVAGDGQGNALCAECHYNLHGVPTSERGLVKFAPDVEPYNGQILYDAATQSCTLTCHGRPHDGLTFQASQPGT